MLLDSQITFRESYMKALKKGEEVTLPPGYDALYQEWATKNENVLYQWSAEQMTERFSIFVDEQMQKMTLTLLNETVPSMAEQMRWKLLLARRQLILASSNGGITFDKLITAADIEQANALGLVLLSPTLHETTANLQEVLDDQAKLYITGKLKNQGYIVQDVQMREDRTIEVIAEPGKGATVILVDFSQDITKPLQLLDGETKKVVDTIESQMPEGYGQAEGDITIIEPTEEQLGITASIEYSDNSEREAIDAANAVNAVQTGAAVQNALNMVNAETATEAQERAQAAMAAPLLQAQAQQAQLSQLSDVMTSKKTVAARTERNAKKMRREQEIHKEIAANRERDAREWREEQEGKEASFKKRQEKQKKQNRRMAAATGGILGLVGGATAGTALFLNHINIIL